MHSHENEQTRKAWESGKGKEWEKERVRKKEIDWEYIIWSYIEFLPKYVL